MVTYDKSFLNLRQIKKDLERHLFHDLYDSRSFFSSVPTLEHASKMVENLVLQSGIEAELCCKLLPNTIFIQRWQKQPDIESMDKNSLDHFHLGFKEGIRTNSSIETPVKILWFSDLKSLV